MHETAAARRLEEALSGASSARTLPDARISRHLEVATELVATNAIWARELSPSTQRRIASANQQAANAPPAPVVEVGWRRARVLVPSVALAVVLLIALVPGARVMLARSFVQVLESVFVGEHTRISKFEPQTRGEIEKNLDEFRSGLVDGRRWFVHTPYSGIGGNVPPGRSAEVHKIETLDEIHTLTDIRVQVPALGSLGEPAEFSHALLAPDGMLLAFFGLAENEVFMIEAPVGHGRSVGFTRPGSELRTETLTVNGQDLVWDPAPTDSNGLTSALRWEADDVSYSIYGRSFTKERAIEIYLSLKPL